MVCDDVWLFEIMCIDIDCVGMFVYVCVATLVITTSIKIYAMIAYVIHVIEMIPGAYGKSTTSHICLIYTKCMCTWFSSTISLYGDVCTS